MGELHELKIDLLIPTQADNRKGDSLVASIKSVGILQPLTVVQNGANYDVVFGHRRLKGAKEAGLKTVPCIVIKEMAPDFRVEAGLIENLLREDISPLEEATGYAELLNAGWTQVKIAQRMGHAQGHVSKRIALLDLHPDVQKKLREEKIDLNAALAVGKLPKEHQTKVFSERYQGGNRNAEFIVSQVERDLDRAVAKTASEKLLKSLKIVPVQLMREESMHPNWYDRKEKPLERLGVKEEAHAKLPCHGAMIDPSTGEIIWLCTTPSNHLTPEQKTSRVKADTGAERAAAAERERAKLAAEARKRREDFAIRLLKTKVARPTHDYSIPTLVLSASNDQVKLAAKLLGLEATVVKTSWGSESRSFDRALTEFMAAGDAQRTKAALAMALAVGELGLRVSYASPGPAALNYVKFLKEQGYAAHFESGLTEKKPPAARAPKPVAAADAEFCQSCGKDEAEFAKGVKWSKPGLCTECAAKDKAAKPEADKKPEAAKAAAA